MSGKEQHLGSYAEDVFVEIFSETFGAEKAERLYFQYPVVDIYGRDRRIDFAVKERGKKIAIEIDGARDHDPERISGTKHEDQLLKQNSIVFQGWEIYRWTYSQLKSQRQRVSDELVTFLGSLPCFGEMDDFLPPQKGEVLELREHQRDALIALDEMRSAGKSIALVTHATGTGKTITALSDAKKLGKPTLFLAHTKELVTQAAAAFQQYWPEAATGVLLAGETPGDSYNICASVQSMSGNLGDFSPERFGYIVVDEAHHGTAETYGRILGHFKADFILGLTATPERSDGEDLLKIFQHVAHRLDLQKAVELGELVPIRCIRIKTNIDLSNVRYNGIKYQSQDLENLLLIPERNDLIVDTWLQYVQNKRTVVFCASVSHAEEVAGKFRLKGVKACAVSGRLSPGDRHRILSEYQAGTSAVLCACDLLNEGWDSPATEVLFMARPTMSKTIYLQQLGRGTRNSPGKEFLMVFDFVDNAGMFNMPYSLHRVLDLAKYRPGACAIGPADYRRREEEQLLLGERPAVLLDYPVDIDRMEIVDIFHWQDKTKGMISQHEFIRMVDVQAETVSRYLREGKLVPDFTVPFSSTSYAFFYQETVERYAQEFKWQLITPANVFEKFIEFVEKMDMSYSYKPVFLKAVFACVNSQGRASIEEVVDGMLCFYQNRRTAGKTVEVPQSIYCQAEIDRARVRRNILANPFKRFEDMHFLRHAKDLGCIEFNQHVWKKLDDNIIEKLEQVCDGKLGEYYERHG